MPFDFKKFMLRISAILIFSLAILIYVFPIYGKIDLALIQPWIDQFGHFTERNNWYLVHLNHKVFKQLLIAVYLSFFVLWLASFKLEKLRPQRWLYGYMFVVSILSTALIGILKSQSAHACPWDMTEKTATGFIWNFTATHGHCFPGGHASTGFALITGFFVFRLVQPKRAWFYLIAGLLLGFMMGWGQMMRGAHFLSHNLWTGWIILCFNTALYAYFYKFFEQQKQSTLSKDISALPLDD
ncbi:phosphatase PAP2 family protein [Acinetobacter sp. 1207_04]|uniref:phosphatase PAP2 family protein n=1 Tax=Acinetobacter sp. 1207_04 TaxID=2604449 RepID=UPI004059D1A4